MTTAHCRFALYDYNGNPKSFYLVERQEISDDASKPAPEVTHHIFVVDRSGSMYSEMSAMRTMLEKLLTLTEYHDSSMLATLISYSSQGDFTVHFSRKTVEQISRPGSPEIESIRNLRVTGLTCISQALREAMAYVAPDETTAISLHSDGYANDRSPMVERREIDAICAEMATKSNVFVNTVAYGPYSDFQLLVGVANALSGKCVQAGTPKDVYNALNDTTALLAGRMSPQLHSALEDADYQVFISRSARRVNGAKVDLVLRGLKPEDDKAVYRYRRVEEGQYLESQAPVAGSFGDLLEPVWAFAAAKISEGQLNTAKFALIATRKELPIRRHYRALTARALAAMYSEMSIAIFDALSMGPQLPQYGLGFSRVPLISILQYLGDHSSALTVDLGHLGRVYRRRGLKKLSGRRLEDGTLEAPRCESRIVGNKHEASVSGFELNNSTASINMLCSRPIEIVKDGEVVHEVAGVSLKDLKSYNNYTVVGDGELCTPQICLRISDKKVFRQLEKWDLVKGDFSPTSFYDLDLSELPLVDFQQAFDPSVPLTEVFEKLATCKIVGSMMNALLKDKSDRFTEEQISELEAYHLTKSLYFSPPSTVPYTDKAHALATGQIDTRVSYEISLGTTQILSLKQLHSANACTDRFFVATIDGVAQDKATLDLWWDPKTRWSLKKLSGRTKITPIDELMKPFFEAFLGLGDPSVFDRPGILSSDLLHKVLAGGPTAADHDDIVELFTQMRWAADKTTEHLMANYLRPLVFYVGATGLLPDELDAPAMTADALKQMCPNLKIGKAESEGSFFVFEGDEPRPILSVFAESVLFSVDQGTEEDDATA